MEKLNSIIEKVNKYAHLDFTLKQYITFAIIGLMALFILYLYFDRVWDYVKDNIIKWDNFCFLKATILMIVPVLAILSLNINPLPDSHLNDWLHFFAIFFILPVIPYLFMCMYRCLFLMNRKFIYFLFRKFGKA